MTLVLFSVHLVALVVANEPNAVRAEFLELRQYVTEQPDSFANAIYFEYRRGDIVRLDHFTESSGVFADYDGDGDVDIYDHVAFSICLNFSGPDLPVPSACEVFDADADTDVDLADAAAFMSAFTGVLSGVVVEAGDLVPDQAVVQRAYASGQPGTCVGATNLCNFLNGIAGQAAYTQDDLWYEWTVETQPPGSGAVVISNASLPATAFTILVSPAEGAYVFRLTATNLITLESGTDTVTLDLFNVECLDDIDCTAGEFCYLAENVCVQCLGAGDCADDGVFCNGEEVCFNRFCSHTDNPCIPFGICSEELAACVECLTDADCIDHVFCDGVESCDTQFGTCQFGTPPCTPSQFCDEINNECDECTVDADCDDALFCNGTETCVSNACVSGSNPCSDCQFCNEDSQSCTSGGGGQTFVLTDRVDAVNGSCGDDTIIGVVQAAFPTLSAGDQINGGGGIDRLNIIVVDADYAPVANISNVENFFVQNADTVAHDFNMAGITGATNLWADRGLSAISFSNIGTRASVGNIGTAKNLTAKFTDSVLAGSADMIQVNLSNSMPFTRGATIIVGSQSGAAIGTNSGPETIMINSVGSANRIASIDDNGENDFVTLSFMGDQACRVDAIGGSVKTINGSAATGDLNINVANADANSLTITGGSGNDTVRSTAMTATDSFDGGAGNDTLDMTGPFSGSTLTDVEVLKVTHSTGTTVTVDLDKAQSASALKITNNGSTLTTLTLTNLPANPVVTLSSNTSLTMSGNHSMSFKSANSSGPADSATLKLPGNGTLNFTGAIATSTSATEAIENITVNVTGGDVSFAVANAFDRSTVNKLAKVTFTGSADVATSNSLGGSVLVEVDASGMTGKLVMTAAANDGAAAITLKGGSGNDTLIAGAGADTLTGGDGNDTLFGLAGIDTITGGSGNDTIFPGQGVDIVDGGADNDDFLFFDDGVDDSDTIANFQIDDSGANDAVGFTIGAGLIATLDTTNSVDIGGAVARGAALIRNLALDATANDSATVTHIIKLTDTTKTSYATAIGTGTVTVAALTTNVVVVFYDATNGVAVVGTVVPGGDNSMTNADVFVEICRLDITAAEYANLDADNFLFF